MGSTNNWQDFSLYERLKQEFYFTPIIYSRHQLSGIKRRSEPNPWPTLKIQFQSHFENRIYTEHTPIRTYIVYKKWLKKKIPSAIKSDILTSFHNFTHYMSVICI